MNKQLRQDSSSDKLLTYFEKKETLRNYSYSQFKKTVSHFNANNNHIDVLHTKSPDKSNTKTNLTSVARKLLTNYLIYIILRRGITLQFKKIKEKNLV